jgi:hypothetical protein
MVRASRKMERQPSAIESLTAAIAARKVILFVGGGISQYLGLPDFHELIEHVSREMEFFETSLEVSDYPIVAEAYLVRRGKLGALRSWMDERWHSPTIDVSKSDIHNLIIDLGFPIIYTTNYDRWLENAFAARKKPFHKVANMADLTVHPKAATEIIKFHGDFEDDESLVLTETSYFQRMSFETPLDIAFVPTAWRVLCSSSDIACTISTPVTFSSVCKSSGRTRRLSSSDRSPISSWRSQTRRRRLFFAAGGSSRSLHSRVIPGERRRTSFGGCMRQSQRNQKR